MSAESDRTKISFLEGAVNEDIRRAMVGRVRSSYQSFASDLELVGSQLDALRHFRKTDGSNWQSGRGKQGSQGKSTGGGNGGKLTGGSNGDDSNTVQPGRERAR